MQSINIVYQLSAGVIPEKATAMFKLNPARSLKQKMYMYNMLSASLYCCIFYGISLNLMSSESPAQTGMDIIFLEQLLHISVQHGSKTRLFWLSQDAQHFLWP